MSQPPVVNGKALVGPLDLADEQYREYEWISEGQQRVYRIADPKELYYRIGGTTHRVVDVQGVTHCVPAPGNFGCVLRWKSTPNPVAF